MAITVCPVTPSFAAEIGDIDLATQIEPANLRAITDVLARYAVLIFPDQRLSQDQHLDFAAHSRSRLRSIERMHDYVYAKNLPTYPISTTTTNYGARKADFGCSN
jgi:hypothetical protein